MEDDPWARDELLWSATDFEGQAPPLASTKLPLQNLPNWTAEFPSSNRQKMRQQPLLVGPRTVVMHRREVRSAGLEFLKFLTAYSGSTSTHDSRSKNKVGGEFWRRA